MTLLLPGGFIVSKGTLFPKRRLAMIARTLRAIGSHPQPRTWPAIGAAQLPRMRGRLELIRDANAVVHIYADVERDLYSAMGYLQGAERLFFIDVLRHIGAGRLSEFAGNLAAPKNNRLAPGVRVSDIDAFLRPLAFEAQSRHDYERLSPHAKDCLDAFAGGVNAALHAMAGVYPPEYLIAGEVRAWHPADSLLTARTCAFIVSLTAFENELTFDAVRGLLGDAGARRLYPEAPWQNVPSTYNVRGPREEPEPPIEVLGVGSNNWAVGAARSASGKPIVANDPHVPFVPLPTFWHHVHLECPEYRVQGGLFPGCPTFGFAHNGSFAWGVTTGFRDAWDLYRIHRVRHDPSRYHTTRGIQPVTRRREVVRSRFGKDVPITWEECEHGILFPGWKHHDGTELAVRHVHSDLAAWFEGHRALASATTVEQYRAGLERVNEGPFDFNHVYAHVGGHFAWELVGKLPKRAGDGLFVRDADDPAGEWDGYIPFAEMPKMVNPERGFVCSANSIVDPNNFKTIAQAPHFEPRFRTNRIEERVGARTDHTTETFAALQSECSAYYAPAQRDALLRLLERFRGAADNKGRAYDLLGSWDGVFEVSSVAATILFFTRHHLAHAAYVALLGDKLGDRYGNGRRALPRLHEMLLDEADPLRADIERAAGKSFSDLAAAAFEKTVAHLEAKGGPSPIDWTWGKFHRARFGTAFSLLPGVGKKFVALDEPFPADEYTVNPSRPIAINGRLYAFVGATSRFICDLARPEEALFAHSSGPSADAGSMFFANLSKPWLRFEYFRSALWKPHEVPTRLEHVVVNGSHE